MARAVTVPAGARAEQRVRVAEPVTREVRRAAAAAAATQRRAVVTSNQLPVPGVVVIQGGSMRRALTQPVKAYRSSWAQEVQAAAAIVLAGMALLAV